MRLGKWRIVKGKTQADDTTQLLYACARLIERLSEEEERRRASTTYSRPNAMHDRKREITNLGSLVANATSRIGELLALVTLVGLICYAITWVAYNVFYSSLGIKPIEVGIDYAAAISRAATTATVTSTLIFVAFSAMLPLLVLFRKHGLVRPWAMLLGPGLLASLVGFIIIGNAESENAELIGIGTRLFGVTLLVMAAMHAISRVHMILRYRWPSLLFPTFVLSAMVVLALSFVISKTTSSMADDVVAWGAGGWLALLFLLYAVDHLLGPSDDSERKRLIRKDKRPIYTTLVHPGLTEGQAASDQKIGLTLFTGIALSLCFLGLYNESAAAGSRAAKMMEDGQHPSTNQTFATILLDFEVKKVELVWLNQKLSDALPSKAFYLGARNDVVILYDPKQCQAIRVPTGTVVAMTIPTDSEMESCRSQPDG
jgi:uncharacterized membrane protein YciS (DUF1049 family)